MLYSKLSVFINGFPSVPILQSNISVNSGLQRLINCKCSSIEIYFGLLSYLPVDIFTIEMNGIPVF